jgi:hypothetical protein
MAVRTSTTRKGNRAFDEIGSERAIKIIDSMPFETNSRGCHLFTGSRNTDGYGQKFLKPNSKLHQTGRSAQSAYLIHHLSAVAHGILDGMNAGHVSHLCDQRSCFNPDHLCVETARENNSRKGCPGTLKCQCDHIVFTCPHFPACIRG